MTVELVPLDLIDDNPFQPRSSYSTKKIEELAYSIKENGLRQTPVGRRVDGRYQLAYGHYRLRAFKKLSKQSKKFGEMPLDVQDISDKNMAIYALEENLRRDDITPIDVARSVDLYLKTFADETESSLAKQLNQTQGNISNMRRVLRLSDKILEKIDTGQINFTMARELLVFEGLNVGTYSEWSAKEKANVVKPKDGEHLMLQALRGIGGQYGKAATVEGMQRSIHDVARSNLKALETDSQHACWDGRKPLFDTRAAGCLKCPSTIKTHPTKSEVRHYCTDLECWDDKQKKHQEAAAVAAKQKMAEDIMQRVAKEVPKQARKDIIYVDAQTLAKIHASYSGDRISEHQPVRKPFLHDGKFYISTGGSGGSEEAYLLMPRDAFTGEVRTYSVPPGREYDEYYESLRNDPNGFYHGMLVKQGKEEHVLVGPEVTFVLEGTISQEIPPPEELPELEIGEEEKQEMRARMKQLEEMPADYPCKGCLNVAHCSGQGTIATEDEGYFCKDRLTKEGRKNLHEKATVEIPPELQEAVKEKAGTRAQVLDLRELKLGSYGALQQGYIELSAGFPHTTLEIMDDPQECLERCTTGFHYAFNSEPRPAWASDRDKQTVRYVCSNPKCLAKKKAAFTRAKNAEGQAKKKAELSAIKQAVVQTTDMDWPRVKLTILALFETRSYSYTRDHTRPDHWFANKLGIEVKDMHDDKKLHQAIFVKLEEKSFEFNCRLLVEFLLLRLTYQGDIHTYKIQTTEALNWMGIGINVPRPDGNAQEER